MKKSVKKIFVIALLVEVCASEPGVAAWKMSSTNACFRHNHNSFYYCGHQSLGCAGRDDDSGDTRRWYYNGDVAKMDDVAYWCCNGTHTEKGIFQIKKGNESFYVSQTTRRKDLGNGAACMQTVRVNVCNTTEIEDCTQPEARACPSGTRFRNNTCAAVCPATQAYVSATSNDCVDCPTTTYQGVVNGVCVKCDSATQFFAYDQQPDDSRNGLTNLVSTTMRLSRTGRCVSKSSSEYKQLSKTDLQYGEGKTISSGRKCWEKTSSDEYKNCIFETPDTGGSSGGSGSGSSGGSGSGSSGGVFREFNNMNSDLQL